jgi:hypothetical protein
MKIIPDDYKRLERLILETVREYKIHSISDYNVSQVRYVWDILHATTDRLQFNQRIEDYLFIRGLYDRLNDDHITTALKRILCEKDIIT